MLGGHDGDRTDVLPVLSDPVSRLRTEAEKEETEEPNYGELALALWDFALTSFLAP